MEWGDSLYDFTYFGSLEAASLGIHSTEAEYSLALQTINGIIF